MTSAQDCIQITVRSNLVPTENNFPAFNVSLILFTFLFIEVTLRNFYRSVYPAKLIFVQSITKSITTEPLSNNMSQIQAMATMKN